MKEITVKVRQMVEHGKCGEAIAAMKQLAEDKMHDLASTLTVPVIKSIMRYLGLGTHAGTKSDKVTRLVTAIKSSVESASSTSVSATPAAANETSEEVTHYD